MNARSVLATAIGLLFFLSIGALTEAQSGFGWRWGPRRKLNIVSRFDSDENGRLDARERQKAREYVREARGTQNQFSQSSPVIPAESDLLRDLQESSAEALARGGTDRGGAHSIDSFESIDLFDEKTLRTLYLRFSIPDWFGQLTDFNDTDVDIPADLIVDGKVYPGVGVHFRGSSSYFTIENSLKKSFNISIDYEDEGQRLYGYRTLNLLNGHADPSFIREVLYSRISRQYIPAPKANFIKLVINGVNWGVYINSQQFNNDFLQDWFGAIGGVRWKVPPGRNGGLKYIGADPEAYKGGFEIQTEDTPEAWRDLVALCEVLTNTPDDRLEVELSRIFNIDGALWFLALENVFIDSDGYFSRGSDYSLYQDPQGRFHLITRDNNETFRYVGGGGPNRWPTSEPMLSPLTHLNNPDFPVISRLLALPHLRSRYLAYIKTISEQWLDWKVIGPIVTEYKALIDRHVNADDKKLYSYASFVESLDPDNQGGKGAVSGGFSHRGSLNIKTFVNERREFLLSHPEINKPYPTITSVRHQSNPTASNAMRVHAMIDPQIGIASVILNYSSGTGKRYTGVPMYDDGSHHDGHSGDGEYAGEIPAFSAGTIIRYYVEARAIDTVGTTSFEPRETEWGALAYRIGSPFADSSPVVINELMALNSRSMPDPQGDYDDWFELHNTSDLEVDLSGMYLTDRQEIPRKWTIPHGTTIPPLGYLIFWADEDGTDEPGLHVNFKLSGKGERLMLIDTDERGNRVLDSIEFGKQESDTALGRFPNGTGDFRLLPMTPGKRNDT